MCAIFGVIGVRKAAELAVIGLHANQHRAIDYAGIVTSDGSHFYRKCGSGIARQVFDKAAIDQLHGKDALGHLRYPTVTDNKTRENVQPVMGIYHGTPVAVAHNGNLTNIDALAKLVPATELTTSMDTEFIVRLLELENGSGIEEDLVHVLGMLEGSFSLGVMLPGRFYAARDRSGNRPLSVGKLGDGYVISSETCAFPSVGAQFLFDVEPGTVVCFDGGEPRVKVFAAAMRKQCRFEAIYYSHPASSVFGEDVGQFRLALGRALEEHAPVAGADLVTSIPDSSTMIAMGFGDSGRSGRFYPAITRNHYVGRSFIAATQAKRDEAVANKFTFAESAIRGKRIVVVDDSIVRGTTMPPIVEMLRHLGAREVHLRIGSPPIKHPCLYGINTPTEAELIAARMTVEKIRQDVRADSLEFLPLPTLQTLSSRPQDFCFACMTGEYWHS